MKQVLKFARVLFCLLAVVLPVKTVQAQRAPVPTLPLLGQILGMVQGCGDTKAVPALSACLDRHIARQSNPATARKTVLSAADTARRARPLRRPGVCHRAQLAARVLVLWDDLCKDLGPPPY